MSSTVKSFVLRSLNRKKAALLALEARHNNPKIGYCSVCGPLQERLQFPPVCPALVELRADVAAGEIALKQAEAIR